VCSSPSCKWDFFCGDAANAKEWTNSIRDAIDTYGLKHELDDDIGKVSSTKEFSLLSASFGILDKQKYRLDVTEKLRAIVSQQGGDHLMLHAGPKEKILGQVPTKKTIIIKQKKQFKLHIMYNARGIPKQATFDEKDAVSLNAAS